jgi:hypothetical protein
MNYECPKSIHRYISLTATMQCQDGPPTAKWFKRPRRTSGVWVSSPAPTMATPDQALVSPNPRPGRKLAVFQYGGQVSDFDFDVN